ncbi:MAG: hypothetical protein EBU85_01110 [Actinobacteria bacterium]|nr:hypothetical protein [Actinomycetota bacterium]
MDRTCPRCAATVDDHVFHCAKCGARVTSGLHVDGIRTHGKPVGDEAFDDAIRTLLENPEALPPARVEPSAAQRAVRAGKTRRGFWRRLFRR